MPRTVRHIFLGWLIAVLCSCQQSSDIQRMKVMPCAPMPEGRASATAFVIGEQAYIFAGRDSADNYTNTLWRYTPATDSWENLGATPLRERVNPASCIVGNKAYVGLGFCGRYGQDTTYLRDWWQYEPALNKWTRLSDYPEFATARATAFTGENELYVGYGFCWNYRRDMFRYSLADDRWDSIDVSVSFHGYPTRSFGGTGCSCGGRHFMGTGYYGGSLNWWAEFMPEGRWEKRAHVPNPTRTLAATAATDEYIFLCGGIHMGGVNTTGKVLQDILRYDPQTDSWQRVASMPEPILNHIGFRIGEKVYFGLGEDDQWQVTNKLYRIEE